LARKNGKNTKMNAQLASKTMTDIRSAISSSGNFENGSRRLSNDVIGLLKRMKEMRMTEIDMIEMFKAIASSLN